MYAPFDSTYNLYDVLESMKGEMQREASGAWSVRRKSMLNTNIHIYFRKSVEIYWNYFSNKNKKYSKGTHKVKFWQLGHAP